MPSSCLNQNQRGIGLASKKTPSTDAISSYGGWFASNSRAKFCIQVSVTVSDLPEVQEKIVKRLDDYRSRLEPPDLRRAQKSALKYEVSYSTRLGTNLVSDHSSLNPRSSSTPGITRSESCASGFSVLVTVCKRVSCNGVYVFPCP